MTGDGVGHVRRFEPLDLVCGEPQLLGRERILHMRGLGRADDRGGHARLVQEPCERDLGAWDAARGRDLGNPVDDREIDLGPVKGVGDSVIVGTGRARRGFRRLRVEMPPAGIEPPDAVYEAACARA